MPKHLKLENCPALEAATDAMDGMEPELRQLAGLLVALRVLGEADDAIEPVAISSLAKSAVARWTISNSSGGPRSRLSAMHEKCSPTSSFRWTSRTHQALLFVTEPT
jgi:hypothetical protein